MVAFRLLLSYLVIYLIGFSTCFTAYAQADFSLESGNKLTTELSSEYGQISNFLNQSNNEKSTGYFKVEPSVFLQTQMSRHLMQLNGKVSHYKFTDFDEDDHSDLLLQPKYFFKLDSNKTLFAEIKWSETYEYRGTNLSLGDAESLNTGDEKKTVSTNFGYLYGQEGSLAKLKLSIGNKDFRYKTRRAQSYLLDRIDTSAKAEFDYLLSGKTYFAIDFNYTQSDFKNNSSLNKNRSAALIGVKWQSTAITQFQALAGYHELNFDDKSVAKDDGFKWRVALNWRPTNFMQVNINTQRDFETANRIADSYRVVDSTNLQISNQFTDFFKASTVLGYKKEEIVYPGETDNEDYFYSEVKLNYQRNEWLSLFVGFIFKELDASEDNLNYQAHSLSLGFSVII
jgi:hypothetical protein